MNVLIACLLNPTLPRLWGRTVQTLFRQEWSGALEYLFLANDNPHAAAYANIAHNYNKARTRALQGGFDALLTVECDMVLPHDALTRLAACQADLAYGLYVWRHGRRKWSAYPVLEERHGVSISDDMDGARAVWGTVIPVAGVGLGCTLIRRRVLEALPFRVPADGGASCDWALALDAQRHGFTQRADLGCVCGHQTMQPYPMVLWPAPDVAQGYLAESLVPLRASVPGETVEIQVGMGTTPVFAMPVQR